MNRHLTLSVLTITLAFGGIASAQHPGHHHHAGHHHAVGAVVVAPYAYGYGGYGYPGYGYGYGSGYPYSSGGNFVSLEESYLRGAGYYNQATGQMNLYNAQANVLNTQAYKQALENNLHALQNRYARGVAMAEGKANVKQTQAMAKAAADHLREERTAANAARMERERKLATVDVDITSRLSWPEALQDKSLATLRNDMHAALGGDRRLVDSLDSLNVEAVKASADAMFAQVKARRDDLGDFRVIAAKRYLDGVVRAAQAAGPGETDGSLAASRSAKVVASK
jgi:hypothetical protein